MTASPGNHSRKEGANMMNMMRRLIRARSNGGCDRSSQHHGDDVFWMKSVLVVENRE
jgi:hypothetical protein